MEALGRHAPRCCPTPAHLRLPAHPRTGDKRTARDARQFLLRWLDRFPQYRDRAFWLAGESYAGHCEHRGGVSACRLWLACSAPQRLGSVLLPVHSTQHGLCRRWPPPPNILNLCRCAPAGCRDCAGQQGGRFRAAHQPAGLPRGCAFFLPLCCISQLCAGAWGPGRAWPRAPAQCCVLRGCCPGRRHKQGGWVPGPGRQATRGRTPLWTTPARSTSGGATASSPLNPATAPSSAATFLRSAPWLMRCVARRPLQATRSRCQRWIPAAPSSFGGRMASSQPKPATAP